MSAPRSITYTTVRIDQNKKKSGNGSDCNIYDIKKRGLTSRDFAFTMLSFVIDSNLRVV